MLGQFDSLFVPNSELYCASQVSCPRPQKYPCPQLKWIRYTSTQANQCSSSNPQIMQGAPHWQWGYQNSLYTQSWAAEVPEHNNNVGRRKEEITEEGTGRRKRSDANKDEGGGGGGWKRENRTMRGRIREGEGPARVSTCGLRFGESKDIFHLFKAVPSTQIVMPK